MRNWRLLATALGLTIGTANPASVLAHALVHQHDAHEAHVHVSSLDGHDGPSELSAPDHPGKRSKFEGELYELLEQDPAFAHELQSLLAQAAVTQTATQSGTGNKLVQNTGHNNKIEIS